MARRSGTVDYVDSQRIVVRVEGETESMSREMGADIYPMTKFKRSNQNTCINQKPIVRVGQKVHKGQILADGPCTELGELALGRNVLVAFMPWRGYNFEDAILVSGTDGEGGRLHVHPHRGVRDRGARHQARAGGNHPRHPERRRGLPARTSTRAASSGSAPTVKPGDILVGKVTPKGETQLTPEEKLLRAIFGEKAGDVRDASLVCPPGIEGIIVGVKIFSRKGIEKDDRAQGDRARRARDDGEEPAGRDPHPSRRSEEARDRHAEGAGVARRPLRRATAASGCSKKGTPLTEDVLQDLPYEAIVRLKVNADDPRLEEDLRELEERTERQVEVIRNQSRGEEGEGSSRRRAASGRHQAGQGATSR